MKAVDFSKVDKITFGSDNYIQGYLIQSKMIEWACLSYSRSNGNVADALSWLLSSAYPTLSSVFDININTEKYLKLKKYYNEVENKDVPKNISIAQNLCDTIVRSGDETKKVSVFPDLPSDYLDKQVKYITSYDFDTQITSLLTKTIDKDRQLKPTKTEKYYISNVFEIISYVFMIDKIIYSSFKPTWESPTDSYIEGELYIGPESKYMDIEYSNYLQEIPKSVKDNFINITAACFSKFIAMKMAAVRSNCGLSIYKNPSRKLIMDFLCDLLIDFYRYNIVVDTCTGTFNDSVTDACQQELNIFYGVPEGTFNIDQKNLYSYTMSMFCPRPKSDPTSLYNLTDGIIEIFEFDTNNKLEIKNKDKYKDRNGISRLFSPRGSSQHYTLNMNTIKDIFEGKDVVEPSHGSVINHNIKDILTNSESVFNKLTGVDYSKIMKNGKTPMCNLANTSILGGSVNDIVNSILLTGNHGFITTFGIVDFKNEFGDYGITAFYRTDQDKFQLNEFYLLPVWANGELTEFSLAQSFNFHSNDISVDPGNIKTNKISFNNKYGSEYSMVRCSGNTVVSFMKNESKLSGFYKPFLYDNYNLNDTSLMFMTSPGEYSFLINEYYSESNMGQRVKFRKLSESRCSIMDKTFNAIRRTAGKKEYESTYVLWKTKIPLFNVFRSNLLIGYLCQNNLSLFSTIPKGLLDKDLQKFYNVDNIPMTYFELKK